MTQMLGKPALLAQIEHEQALWQQFVAEVPQERMLEPGATGYWTFKDTVAHLDAWRIRTQERLDAARQGRSPAAPPWPAGLSEEDDIDQINEWLYQANRERPLEAVLDAYHGSFQRMSDAVAALSDEELSQPERYPWMDGYPLAAVLASSFEHFHIDHEPGLRAWLA